MALVLDLNADFDIVLGMEWFLEWEPNWHYRPLSLSIHTAEGVKRIMRMPIKDEFTVLNTFSEETDTDLKFNLMTIKEVKKAMKTKPACMLYFAKSQFEVDSDIEFFLNDTDMKENSWHGVQLNGIAEMGCSGESDETPKVDDLELQELLNEYRDVWKNELPDGLPPKRAVDHGIDTGVEKPVNRNAYPLSVVQLQEQTKQIEVLLK